MDVLKQTVLTGPYSPREAVLGALTNLQSERPQPWSEGWLDALKEAAELLPEPYPEGEQPHLTGRVWNLPEGRRVFLAEYNGQRIIIFERPEGGRVQKTYLALSNLAMFALVMLYLEPVTTQEERESIAGRIEEAERAG